MTEKQSEYKGFMNYNTHLMGDSDHHRKPGREEFFKLLGLFMIGLILGMLLCYLLNI